MRFPTEERDNQKHESMKNRWTLHFAESKRKACCIKLMPLTRFKSFENEWYIRFIDINCDDNWFEVTSKNHQFFFSTNLHKTHSFTFRRVIGVAIQSLSINDRLGINNWVNYEFKSTFLVEIQFVWKREYSTGIVVFFLFVRCFSKVKKKKIWKDRKYINVFLILLMNSMSFVRLLRLFNEWWCNQFIKKSANSWVYCNNIIH